MLDDAPGPWLIDGSYKPFLSDRRSDGYRAHDCARVGPAPLSVEVLDTEFLWP